jgi:hypothetical protein
MPSRFATLRADRCGRWRRPIAAARSRHVRCLRPLSSPERFADVPQPCLPPVSLRAAERAKRLTGMSRQPHAPQTLLETRVAAQTVPLGRHREVHERGIVPIRATRAGEIDGFGLASSPPFESVDELR